MKRHIVIGFGMLLLGVADIAPASAQTMVNPNGYEIAAAQAELAVRQARLVPLTRPVLRDGRWVLFASDRTGGQVRVAVDARTGQILAIRLLAMGYPGVPRPSAIVPDPGYGGRPAPGPAHIDGQPSPVPPRSVPVPRTAIAPPAAKPSPQTPPKPAPAAVTPSPPAAPLAPPAAAAPAPDKPAAPQVAAPASPPASPPATSPPTKPASPPAAQLPATKQDKPALELVPVTPIE